jgi:hypothetical protein
VAHHCSPSPCYTQKLTVNTCTHIHVKISEARQARIVLTAGHTQGHNHNSLQVQMVDIHLLLVRVCLRDVGSKCEPYEHRSSFHPRGASIRASLAKNQHLSRDSQGRRATEGKRSSVTTQIAYVRLYRNSLRSSDAD